MGEKNRSGRLWLTMTFKLVLRSSNYYQLHDSRLYPPLAEIHEEVHKIVHTSKFWLKFSSLCATVTLTFINTFGP